MKFSHPLMFYLIWGVFFSLVVVIYGHRKRTKVLSGFMAEAIIRKNIPGYSPKLRVVKAAFILIALFFGVISTTGPLLGFRWEKVEQKGVDIMIALDCSRSMLATDIRPTRLEQAKREIIDLLKMMRSDRAGLVAFAGTSILQCPLTLDHSAFGIFLKALDPDYLPMGGTDIGGAIRTALNGFEKEVDSEKAIIIITDGENTSGEPFEIAKEAAEQNVRIFCIGVGQEEGAPVPDPDGGFKKDKQGRIIMSRTDDEGLRKISAVARGIYVKSVAGDMDLDRIYTGEILKNMEKKTVSSGRKKVWEDRFQWVLLPCVFFLIVELLLSEQKNNLDTMPWRRRKEKSKSTATGKKVSILLVLCFSTTLFYLPGICLAGASKSVSKGIEEFKAGRYESAQKHFIDAQLQRPELPELYYNIGTAAYMNKDYDGAMAHFSKALDAEDPVLRDKAAFNLGNTAYRMGDYDEALKAFEKIPETSFLYKESRENLAFVKKKMEEQKNNPPEEQQKERNKEENDRNKEKKDGTGQNQDQQNRNEQQDAPEEESGKEKEQEQNENSEKNGENDQQDKKNDMKKASESNASSPDKKEDAQSADKGKNEREEQAAETDPAAPGKTGEETRRQQAQQRLLNRLEDKPGSAMMPVYGGQTVEKDW